ncbi:MAG: hypothetical protein H7834_15585 [Magnetococcus sp. YQC-9]
MKGEPKRWRWLGWIHLLLIVLVAWELAEWTWRVVVPEHGMVTGFTESERGGEGNPKQSRSGRGVEEGVRGVFGGSLKQPERHASALNGTEAPVTRLNARLLGILFASDNSVVWRALISGEGIAEGSYGVGERVGPAMVVKIEWDRVVLELNGRLETLRLPKLESGPVVVETNARKQVSAETQALIGTLWGQFESSALSGARSELFAAVRGAVWGCGDLGERGGVDRPDEGDGGSGKLKYGAIAAIYGTARCRVTRF